MDGFSVGVVADLCEAVAELIAKAPEVALFTAKKLGATLRRRIELADEQKQRELRLRELRASQGLPEFG